jgi:nitroreductase
MATNSGIRLHQMNQILQLPEIKAEVTKRIPMEGVMPQLTFRLGYAEPEKEHSPRRPLNEVLIEQTCIPY